MGYICTRCGLSSEDGNLWCQRPECSTLNLTTVLRRGDRIGEFEIKNLLRVMRTAAVYEAIHYDEKPVLLKIAHYDSEELIRTNSGCSRYLKSEAERLQLLQKQGIRHESLPAMLPPYRHTRPNERPYGRIVYQDQLRYYIVFDHVRGQFLREYLNNNPQPHYQQAGWMVYTLAELITVFHLKLQNLHLALTPDVILLRHDEEGILRPMLLDFGFHGITYEGSANNLADYTHWLSHYLHPAYTPPEMLLETQAPGRRADVYGLGLLLYEMLAGRPAYEYKTQTEEMIRVAVKDARYKIPLNRVDLAPEVNRLVDTALSHDAQQRQGNVADFAKQLRGLFGEPPREKAEGSTRKLGKWVSKHYVPISVTVGVFILTAIIIFGILNAIG